MARSLWFVDFWLQPQQQLSTSVLAKRITGLGMRMGDWLNKWAADREMQGKRAKQLSKD